MEGGRFKKRGQSSVVKGLPPPSAALKQWSRLTRLNRSRIIRKEPVYKQKASWLRLFLNDFLVWLHRNDQSDQKVTGSSRLEMYSSRHLLVHTFVSSGSD